MVGRKGGWWVGGNWAKEQHLSLLHDDHTMNHYQTHWGRPRDDVYGSYNYKIHDAGQPKVATQQPIVTGTSVIGIKFDKGVILAADNLGKYRSSF
jgi:hypothetical protein